MRRIMSLAAAGALVAAILSIGTALAVSVCVGYCPGRLSLATSSPYLNNNAINWGQYVDLTTTSGAGTSFMLQVSTDQSTWTTIANLRTNTRGKSTYRYRPVRNYWYRAGFGNFTGGPHVESNQLRVTVRQRIAISPNSTSTKTVAQGTTVTFTTTSPPARSDLPKAKVVFQTWEKVSGTWKLIATETKFIDGAGIAKFSQTFSTPGSWYFRAQTQPTTVNANSFWTPNQYYNTP